MFRVKSTLDLERFHCNRRKGSSAPPSNRLHANTLAWSPDGSCLLVSDSCKSDNLMLLNYPHPQPPALHQDEEEEEEEEEEDWQPAVTFSTPEPVYATAWFPRMSSHHPDSCLFAASVRDNGIRLYNPFTRSLDATYISQDHVERLCAPHALSFSPDGKWIYAGYDSRLEIWNVDRPGYDKISLPTRQKYDNKGGGQSGIISCLEFNPDHSGLFACGSFSGSVGLYDQSSPSLIASLTSLGGVVQTTFSPDGTRLYTSSRKSDEIRCWDIRNTGRMLDQTLIRPGMTNQRLRFAVDPESGRFLASGDTRGNLDIFDLQDFNVEAAADRQHISPIVCEKVHNEAAADRQHISPIVCEKVHGDTIAAVDFHPVYSGIMASVSGQRRIDGIGSNAGTDCSVKVFSI